jgi:hypothetical protein
MSGWIGVDLDGTLAQYSHFIGPTVIGDPIEPMVTRVKQWLAKGIPVKIFTARVCGFRMPEERKEVEEAIQDWCKEHIGIVLPITNEKDYGMVELWDDRCVQVIPNTGMRADGK